MLDVAHSAEARQISRMSALWSSNCFAPIAANIDKYKKVLSMDEIATIETLTNEYMQRYGYERLTGEHAPVDAGALEAAHAASDRGRDEAWRELERTNFRDFALRRHRAEYLASVRARMERCADERAIRGAAAPAKLDELTERFEVTD
jgi:hypothetical protein